MGWTIKFISTKGALIARLLVGVVNVLSYVD